MFAKKKPKTLEEKITAWAKDRKGFIFSTLLGVVFLFLGFNDNQSALVLWMQTAIIFVYFVGMMLFVYNVGYLTIMISVDEGLRPDEREVVNWIIKRSAIVSGGWFIGIMLINMVAGMNQWNTAFLAAANSFLLALLFLFIRSAENPLTEEVSL